MCILEVGSVHSYNNIALDYWPGDGEAGMILCSVVTSGASSLSINFYQKTHFLSAAQIFNSSDLLTSRMDL